MGTEVRGVRMDDTQTFGIEIDGIIGVGIPYIVGDKFPGLTPAILKAAVEWAADRDRSPTHTHEWVDIRNSTVQSGSMCRTCGALRAEDFDQQERRS